MAAGLLGLGVAAAAIGSHALASSLDAEGLRRFQTATQVLMWQALGLLALLRWATDAVLPRFAAILLTGTLLFCGSVYALAFGAPRGAASLAPFGGLLMIGGWLGAAVVLWRSR